MKILLTTALLISSLAAEEPVAIAPEKDAATRIEDGSMELAEAQDELSADVMELVEDQTVPKVIELLEEVEKIMAEVTDDLVEAETGGPTLAAQTEIIEKIFEAAKQKQQASEGSPEDSQESMGAMLDMMERMMGKEPGDQEGKGEGEGEGEKPGENAGEGMTGDSDSKNKGVNGESSGDADERIIPKGSGPAGRALPGEFRKLLDAYNRNTAA